jgi:hypothetical protein
MILIMIYDLIQVLISKRKLYTKNNYLFKYIQFFYKLFTTTIEIKS